MRILLVGEYSNVHATLAEALRTLGHEVCVISNGDFWKDYPRDIDVARRPGKWGGIRLMARLYRLLPRLRGYDVVQLINPMFFELKAERLYFFYDYLRSHNGKVFLGAFGMDWYWVHECVYKRPLRYSDFNIGNQLRSDAEAMRYRNDWLGTPKGKLNRYIADDCDGIITGLYEYDVCYRPHFPEKTTFIPFPIRTQGSAPKGSDFSAPQGSDLSVSVDQGSDLSVSVEDDTEGSDPALRLFIGINKERSAYKGTDIMLRAAEDIARKYPDRLTLQVAESVPFAEYQRMMDRSDAILDQLYSYTPSMNALLAMSKGIVCIGGGEPENYDIIGERELRPIINVEPTYESVFSALESLVLHPEQLPALQQESRTYIHRHHDHLEVARRYLDAWQR